MQNAKRNDVRSGNTRAASGTGATGRRKSAGDGNLGRSVEGDDGRLSDAGRALADSNRKLLTLITARRVVGPVDMTRQFSGSPKMARLGESLLGTRRVVIWPTPEQFAAYATPPKPMSAEIRAHLRDVSATKPRDNGDEVAKLLRECDTLDDVYRAGAKYLGEKEPTLRKKYAHLNPGQQRMVIGNRMRAKSKKGL